MKRYLIFVYSDYYPCGGFQDYIGQTDTFSAAKLAVENSIDRNNSSTGGAQIVDTKNEVVHVYGITWGSSNTSPRIEIERVGVYTFDKMKSESR